MVARNQSRWRSPACRHPDLRRNYTRSFARGHIKHTENSWRTPNNQVQARDAYGGHVTFPGGDKTQDDLNAAREQAYEDMVKRNEDSMEEHRRRQVRLRVLKMRWTQSAAVEA